LRGVQAFLPDALSGENVEQSAITAGESQRERLRDSLFMGAKVSIGASRIAVATVIRNLSDGGVMIDSPNALKKGDRLTTHLRNLGEVPGTVAWVHNGRAGVMFDDKIDPDSVRSAIMKASSPAARPVGKSSAILAAGATLDVNIPGLGPMRATVDWVEDTRLVLSFDRALV
jgi:hypothetical protein